MNAFTRLSLKELSVIFNCSVRTAQQRKKEVLSITGWPNVRVIDVAFTEKTDTDSIIFLLQEKAK